MNLRIHVPAGNDIEVSVRKIVAEAPNGSFCLLPRHVDFTSALAPGILAYEDESGMERFVALDRGILVKRGDQVDVAALRAVQGPELEDLKRAVREVFEQLDDSEQRARSALAKLAVGFQRRFLESREAAGS